MFKDKSAALILTASIDTLSRTTCSTFERGSSVMEIVFCDEDEIPPFFLLSEESRLNHFR
jgi:hypothetical protein